MRVDVNQFFERINELPPGDHAVLKRNAGTMLNSADGRAITIFYRILPYDVPRKQESIWFAVACIACLWKEPGRTPLESCFSKIQKESETMENRIAHLLDMPWDEDGYFLTKLTRLIKIVFQKGFSIDCSKLLNDLIFWNNENKYVQKNWARALYLNSETNDNQEGEN